MELPAPIYLKALTYPARPGPHPATATASLLSVISTFQNTSQQFQQLSLLFNPTSIQNGICSLHLSPLAPCLLVVVGEDGAFGPAGSFWRGSNADCNLATAGWIHHSPIHVYQTDHAPQQSKVLLVLYDVSCYPFLCRLTPMVLVQWTS